ncbi:phage portal protein [Pseudarthrobacter sp. J64]|uniref:phage portal protein n=1 Tax=Pseudarthrobacter sp. J64 TaxID=3116485 RepID=UPI002E80D1D1|nr:phage portal protein [Pseudarthrobacter sp. J64]MEE2568597.1 phage portal protein [Pseudarthrobacter sp. J64]
MSLFRSSPEVRSLDSAFSSFGIGGGEIMGNSMKQALRLIPLYAATGMIADSISIMPVSAYEETGGAKQKMATQPALIQSPHTNPIFTRVEWLHQFTTSYLLRGNSYGLITALDSAGIASKIHWLNPDSVRVDESGPIPKYFYNDKLLDRATVLHIPWYPMPGSVVGLSPLGQFKMQLETGYAAAKYGNDWFRHGTMPSGHLKYSKGELDNTNSARVKALFKEAVAGNDIFVSGNDWDWTALSVKPEEAQFLQTIKASANDIAAIYRVDPEDVGGQSGNSMTYSTLEMNQIKYQTRALQPIFTKLEHHVDRLLPESQYIKFNPDAIVRTDLKTRMEAHEIALRSGMETQDEGREMEDKRPMDSQQKAEWLTLYRNKLTPQSKNGGAA